MVYILFEYLAFGSSIVASFLYKRTSIYGPCVGIFTALMFFTWGYLTGTWAAIFSNCIFLFIHSRNLKYALGVDQRRLKMKIANSINPVVELCYKTSKANGWWDKGIDNPLVVPTKLALCHSELSEALEGHRKNLMDDKLPHRKMMEVELADAVIRIFDLAGAMGFDLGQAIAEKMEFNNVRPDHKPENRVLENGKKY